MRHKLSVYEMFIEVTNRVKRSSFFYSRPLLAFKKNAGLKNFSNGLKFRPEAYVNLLYTVCDQTAELMLASVLLITGFKSP